MSANKIVSRSFLSFIVVMIVFCHAFFSYAQSVQFSQITTTMAERISKTGVKAVAVADFTDLQGNITELGRYLAEQFSVSLAVSGQSLEVVDRTHLKTLLKEHKLSSSGLIDVSTAKQLGKIAGVQALVTGSLTPFGDTVEMTIKVLDTETAKILDARTESLPKTATIQELLGKEITTAEEASPTGNKTVAASVKLSQSVIAKEFTISDPYCKQIGETVTCSVLITNNGKDRRLYLPVRGGNTTRIIDNLGNNYSAKEVYGTDRNSYRAYELYSSGIPMKVNFKFEGITQEAKTVTIVVHGALDGGARESDINAQLKNVPLSK